MVFLLLILSLSKSRLRHTTRHSIGFSEFRHFREVSAGNQRHNMIMITDIWPPPPPPSWPQRPRTIETAVEVRAATGRDRPRSDGGTVSRRRVPCAKVVVSGWYRQLLFFQCSMNRLTLSYGLGYCSPEKAHDPTRKVREKSIPHFRLLPEC